MRRPMCSSKGTRSMAAKVEAGRDLAEVDWAEAAKGLAAEGMAMAPQKVVAAKATVVAAEAKGEAAEASKASEAMGVAATMPLVSLVAAAVMLVPAAKLVAAAVLVAAVAATPELVAAVAAAAAEMANTVILPVTKRTTQLLTCCLLVLPLQLARDQTRSRGRANLTSGGEKGGVEGVRQQLMRQRNGGG